MTFKVFPQYVLAKRAQGFALIVALLLMVALSLIGVTALRNVTLQEKMSGNQYFRLLAFNEAQSTLRIAEQRTFSLFGTTAAPPTTCSTTDPRNLCPIDGGASNLYLSQPSSWSTAIAVGASINSNMSSAWVTERLTDAITLPNCAEVGSTGTVVSCERIYVRTSARGIDAATGASVVNQQFYRFATN